MIKKISYILYKTLALIDLLINKLFKKSFLVWFKDFIHEDSYKNLEILNKKTTFFVPNQATDWRVNTFYTKEPETLKWIDDFDNTKKFIFWDIGSNIGLFSIYAAIKHDNATIISFEPSTSNLRCLSRNISINKLEDKIKILPIALTNKTNHFSMMNEPEFIEGGALNSFGVNFNFEGKKFTPKMNYQIFATNIENLINNKILDFPDYIKIDVDGIEHLILEGAGNCLKNKKIKKIVVEINENFDDQKKNVFNILEKSDFKFLNKDHAKELDNINSKFSKTYNYFFIKN